jgi:hypothetical protein
MMFGRKKRDTEFAYTAYLETSTRLAEITG